MLTADILERRFIDFNHQYFGDVLPYIPIRLKVMKDIACFSFDVVDLHSPLWISATKGAIYINSECGPDEVDGVLLHEMIHVYFAYGGLVYENHGKMFQSKCKKIEQLSHVVIPI